MTEFSDRASFGVSDTGFSQYRTPAPLPTPIPLHDLPYQPIPLTERFLDAYMLRVPGLKGEAFVPLGFESFGTHGTVFDLTGKPLAEKFPDMSGTYQRYWYYKPDGTVLRDAEIRETNAKILAGRVLGGDAAGVSAVVMANESPEGIAAQVNAFLPVVRREQEQRFVYHKRMELESEFERRQKTVGNYLKEFGLAFGTVALSVAFPPSVPFVVGAYAAYTLATTIPQQVETGKVNPFTVLRQVGAVAGLSAAGAAAYGSLGASSAGASAASVPSIPAANYPAAQVAPLSGVKLSVLQASSTPLLGPAPEAIALGFAQSSAYVGSTLGISTPQLLEATRPGLLDVALDRIQQHPVESAQRAASAIELGSGVARAIKDRDWAGLFSLGLREAGSPVSVPRIRESQPVVIPPAVAVDRSAFSVGGRMEEFGLPSDPAGKNVVLYILGGVLLLFVLYGVIKKG